MQKILFDYEIAKDVKPGTKAKTTITEIEEMKGAEAFGAKSRNPEQLLYLIYGKVDGREIRLAVFNKPPTKQISPRSRLAMFKQRYGRFPEVGMKVDVETNENHYWDIVT